MAPGFAGAVYFHPPILFLKTKMKVFCKTCVRRITGLVVKTRVRKQEVAGSNPGEVICFLVLNWEAYLSYVCLIFILRLSYIYLI